MKQDTRSPRKEKAEEKCGENRKGKRRECGVKRLRGSKAEEEGQQR